MRGSALHVFDLGACRDRVLVRRRAAGPVTFSADGLRVRYGDGWTVPVAGGRPQRATALPEDLVSPDGRLTASVRLTRRPGAPTGSLAVWVTPSRGGPARAVYVVRQSYRRIPAGAPGPLHLAAWSPNGRWLFLYVVPQGSASLAADGVELRAVSARGGRPRRVAGMLGYRDYLTWCGNRLVLTAGGWRLATANKWLAVASAPAWRARRLLRAPRRAWGSLACSPDRRTLVAQSQPASRDYNFFRTRWALWVVGLDGSRRQLTRPPRGYADESPRWSRDGRAILFVRSRRGAGRLYLWRRAQVTGPIADLGRAIGYYGHHDWWAAADWWQPRVR